MQRAVTTWLKHQVDVDHHRSGSVERFALRITIKAVAVASIINAIIHLALDQFDLLPYPLVQALVVGFAATATITFVVSFTFMMVVGRAIRELAIQRDAFAHISCTDALSGVGMIGPHEVVQG